MSPLHNGRGVTRLALPLLALSLLIGASGCELLSGPTPEFTTNERVLRAIAESSGYRVEPSLFHLKRAEVEEDSITFFYGGIAFRGDEAWVLRFTRKASEQDPRALTDVYSHLALVRELRAGFFLIDDGETGSDAERIRWVTYGFDSNERDVDGGVLPGLGVLATVMTSDEGESLVHVIHLDHVGERESVDLGTLGPFLTALRD